MRRVPSIVWAALILGAFYAFFMYGIAPITGALTGTPAPLPASLLLMYTGMAAAAILLYFSVREEHWKSFTRPVVEFLRNSNHPSAKVRLARRGVLVLVPLLVGWHAYIRDSRLPPPPADPPGIHFDLPNKYVPVDNPLPWTEENIHAGGVLYIKNCAVCHGDVLDGNGPFARAFQPMPANFRDSGTIAQVDENYVFWRIKEGGPGLPRGSIGYRSAMPAWDGVLTDDEIWKIIMFEYTNAGVRPARRQ